MEEILNTIQKNTLLLKIIAQRQQTIKNILNIILKSLNKSCLDIQKKK